MSKKHTHEQIPQLFLDTVLKPTPSTHPSAKNGLLHAHTTGDFHEERTSLKFGKRLHQGVDFNYFGGQTGINLKHPKFYSPVEGVVINDPMKSNEHAITIRDKAGVHHQFLHADKVLVKAGDKISFGQELGQMGDYNRKNPNNQQHIHYQLYDTSKHVMINPVDYWRKNLSLLQNQAINQEKNQQKEQIQNIDHQMQGTTTLKNNSTPDLKTPTKEIKLEAKTDIRFNRLTQEEYESKIWDFFVKKEGFKTKAYFEGKSIAIGVGYDLLRHNNSEINILLKKTGLPKLTEEQSELLNEARQKKCSSERRKEIAEDLNLNIPKELVKKMFSNSLNEYEKRLDDRLKPYDIPESTERIALLSLTYHGRLRNYEQGPSVLKHIRSGLENGNRQEIWHAIRTDIPPCKAIHKQGYINRANSEAHLFSAFEKSIDQTRPLVLTNYMTSIQSNRGQQSFYDQFIANPAEKVMNQFKLAVDFLKSKIQQEPLDIKSQSQQIQNHLAPSIDPQQKSRELEIQKQNERENERQRRKEQEVLEAIRRDARMQEIEQTKEKLTLTDAKANSPLPKSNYTHTHTDNNIFMIERESVHKSLFQQHTELVNQINLENSADHKLNQNNGRSK